MKKRYTQNFKLPRMTIHQSGVTLIEALVTLLVLAVGALGIASMQLAGLKYTSGSYARTQAVILADDMANRLKANRNFALNFNNGLPAGPSPYAVINTFNAPTPAGVNCLGNSTQTCTPQQLANYDIVTWRNELARVLPSGRGSITTINRVLMNGVNQRQFNISVQWRQVSNSTQILQNTNNELKAFTFRILL